MILLVDDLKSYPADLIARTYEEAVSHLCNYGIFIERILIDFDLGDADFTGEDVLKFCFETNLYPPEISIITLNPVGFQRLKNLLIDNGYVRAGNTNIWVF